MCYEMHAWIRKSKILTEFATLRGPRLRLLLIDISGNRSYHFEMTNDGLRMEFTILSPGKL